VSESREPASQSPPAPPLPRPPASQSPPAVPEPRTDPAPAEPGVATTEFWGTQISSLVTLAMALGADFGWFSLTGQQKADVTMAAMLMVGLLQGAYAAMRSWRKKGTPG
jgi:hypothetical protein